MPEIYPGKLKLEIKYEFIDNYLENTNIKIDNINEILDLIQKDLKVLIYVVCLCICGLKIIF